MDSERIAALALSNIPGIGPTYAKRLVEAAGNFKNVFEEGPGLSEKASVPPAYLGRLQAHRARAFEHAQQQIEQATKLGIQVIILTQDEYPKRLREIPDPPTALYIYGETDPADDLALGIVGTRKATPAGVKFAEEIAYELASIGITVVSGLALGVDAGAHSGAIDADGGRTLAVLGTGVDVCYPPANRELYERILKSRCGAVISEYPPGTKPEAHHFPVRNRIISGWSLGVVVIEAPERSGALITARMAVEQGREVFAVPQPARSVSGAGTNRLIREGAHLVETAEDIISVIEHQARLVRRRPPQSRTKSAEDPGAGRNSKIFELIRGGVGGLDELVGASKLAVSSVLAELTRLEIEGRIRRVAACTYQSIGR